VLEGIRAKTRDVGRTSFAVEPFERSGISASHLPQIFRFARLYDESTGLGRKDTTEKTILEASSLLTQKNL